MLDDESVRVVTPGEHLKREMKRRDFDQAALAQAVGVSRQVINYSVNDRKPISRSLAAELSRVMGLPQDYWLRSEYFNLPADEQLGVAKAAESDFSSSSVLVDYQIEDAVAGKLIAIDPFDEGCIRQASIDFTLDNKVLGLDGEVFELDEKKTLTLKYGETVNCATRERISLNNRYIGRVGATTALARQGLIIAHGLHVDPGFDGVLQFCITNMARSDFQLQPGMVCISMELLKLQARPKTEFYDPAGDRRSTKQILLERQAVNLLLNVVERHLSEDCVVEGGDVEGFRSGVPELLRLNSSYASKEASINALLEQVRCRLVAIFEGHHGAVLDDFRVAFVRYLEKVRLNRDHVQQIMKKYGFEADSEIEGIFVVRDTEEQKFVEVPTAGGFISAYSLFHQLDLLGPL